MTKTPTQLKNIVEDWIKITNAKFQDITQQEKPKEPRLDWVFKVNNMMGVYMIGGRSDRVTFDMPINFAKEHQVAASKLGDKEFLQFLIEIIEPLTVAGIGVRLQQKEKEIQSIILQTYIDTESFEREKFFRVWDQLVGFREIVIKKTQVKFGVKGMFIDSNATSSNKPYG